MNVSEISIVIRMAIVVVFVRSRYVVRRFVICLEYEIIRVFGCKLKMLGSAYRPSNDDHIGI